MQSLSNFFVAWEISLNFGIIKITLYFYCLLEVTHEETAY